MEIQQAVEGLYKKGWTFNAISQVLGVSRYTVARWLYGQTQPVPAVPILYALRALDQLDVPEWPRPRSAKLPQLTAFPMDTEAGVQAWHSLALVQHGRWCGTMHPAT